MGYIINNIPPKVLKKEHNAGQTHTCRTTEPRHPVQPGISWRDVLTLFDKHNQKVFMDLNISEC